MAKTSKDKRIHKGWKALDVIEFDGHSRFLYKCTGCGVEVMNGQPYSEVNGMDCKT